MPDVLPYAGRKAQEVERELRNRSRGISLKNAGRFFTHLSVLAIAPTVLSIAVEIGINLEYGTHECRLIGWLVMGSAWEIGWAVLSLVCFGIGSSITRLGQSTRREVRIDLLSIACGIVVPPAYFFLGVMLGWIGFPA